MTSIEKYNLTKKFMAFLIGPYGQVTLENNPDLKDRTERVFKSLKESALLESVDNNIDAGKFYMELDQLKQLKSLIPEKSFDSLKSLNGEEEKLEKQLQDLIDYNPQIYYDVYFLTVGLTQKSIEDNILLHNTPKNESFEFWFGTSKVVDLNKNPLVVYHGTGGLEKEFTKFSFDMFPGIYFAENKTYSDWFAQMKAQGSIVFKCYLRVLNPIDLTIFKTDKVTYNDFVSYIELRYGYKLPENRMLKAMSDSQDGMWAWAYLRNGVDWLNYIKKNGEFDGLTFYENNPSDVNDKGIENVTKAWMVFKGNQIKAVNGNSIYSLQTNDIRFKKGGKL
jgi:hypothetical protein